MNVKVKYQTHDGVEWETTYKDITKINEVCERGCVQTGEDNYDECYDYSLELLKNEKHVAKVTGSVIGIEIEMKDSDFNNVM